MSGITFLKMEGEQTVGLAESELTKSESREVEPRVSSQETLKAACLVMEVLQGKGGCQDLVREKKKRVRVLSRKGKETAENLYKRLTNENQTREELIQKIQGLHEYRRQIEKDQDMKDFLQRTLASIEMRMRRQDEKGVREYLQADSLWQPLVEEFGQRLGFRPEQHRVADQFAINALGPAVCQRRRTVLEAVKSTGRSESEEEILGAIRVVEGNRLKELAGPQPEEKIAPFLNRLYEGTLPSVLADLESSPQKQEKLKQVGAEKLEEATEKLERPQGKKLFDEIKERVDQFFPKLKRAAVTGFSGLAVAWLISGCAGQLPSPSAETILSHLRVSKAEAAEQASEDYIAEIRRVEAFLKTSPPPKEPLKDPYIENLADQKLFVREEEVREPEMREKSETREFPAVKKIEPSRVEEQPIVETEEELKEEGWAIVNVSELSPNLQQALEEDGFEVEKERGRILVGAQKANCFASALTTARMRVSGGTETQSFGEIIIKTIDLQNILSLEVGKTISLGDIEVTKMSFEGYSPEQWADKFETSLKEGNIPLLMINGQYYKEGKLVSAAHTGALLSVFRDETGKVSLLLSEGTSGRAVDAMTSYRKMGAESIGSSRNLVRVPLNEALKFDEALESTYLRADVYVVSRG